MLRYGTRENVTSESWDRDNKYISGKMWFQTVKDSIERLVCSWVTSSTIILQDGKQEKPTMCIDQSEIKEEIYFFWSIVNWQVLSLSTPFLSIIKQLCKVDSIFPMNRSGYRKEPVNRQMNWSISMYSTNSSIWRWHNSWIDCPC